MSLKTYQSKRDFRKTTEPSVRKKKFRRQRDLIFVVQEHHARNLHYDFRLEWNGTLKSWAVPKGPSMDPRVKRLAVEVEDHPLDYATFEGTIPEHQYGAGEVYVWDHGTWYPQTDVAKGIIKGHLSFELKGSKLHGHWDLIRTKIPGRNRQWLLIKKEDSYTLAVPRNKNARTERKKTHPKINFVQPELAQLSETVPSGHDWVHEIKFDGYRIQAHIQNGEVHLFTRSGQDWTGKFSELAEDLRHIKVKSAIIDGEVVILDRNGRSNFQLLQNALKNSTPSTLYYYAFDLLYRNGEDLRSTPLWERKKELKALLKSSNRRVRYSQDFVGNGHELLKIAKEHHLEGIICKRRNSHYHSGRNSNWIKVKCLKQQEFVIGGYTEGAGGRGPLGALLLGIYKNKNLQYVGKVGTGFTQASLQEVLKALKKLKRDQSPFDKKSPQGRNLHWVEPHLSADITFSQWTNDEILRAPVFQGLREDKPTQQILKESPIKSGDIETLSHPEKILYAREKITKHDIALFYSKVAKRMIPLVTDRPLSLVRCPQGTGAHCFFQKHPSQITAAMRPFEIEEKNGPETYVSIYNEAGLIDLVQMNAFEIHCSNASGENFEFPNQIVLDLDPGPGVRWKQTIKAAFEVKKILEQLRLKSFVKLSGGKGLHVHVPIKPIYSWDQIASFSQAVARHMEQISPDSYVSKMTKELRLKKIFIDYFRNSRNATAVAPYSLRAHEYSSVALPLTWTQLRLTSASDQFTLPKALGFIRRQRNDPWPGYHLLQQRIHLLEKKSKTNGPSLRL
ncbi:MAG: DNA ligase D [Bdellovibrio sp.]